MDEQFLGPVRHTCTTVVTGNHSAPTLLLRRTSPMRMEQNVPLAGKFEFEKQDKKKSFS